jgi:subtilisin family serine protease
VDLHLVIDHPESTDWRPEMDPLFEAHFPRIKDAFAQRGVKINVAYAADGDVEGARDPQAGQAGRVVDYVYREGYLLTLADGDNIQKIQRALPGIDPIGTPRPGRLVVLSIAGVEGSPSVPQALDIIDRTYPEDAAAADEGKPPLASADHIVEQAKMCAPTEPEVPTGNAPKPWPKPRRARCRSWRPWPRRCGKRTPQILIPDTGLVIGAASHLWLKGVEGDPDELEQRPGQPPLIMFFHAHGTFVAGVARCMAPDAGVFVANLLPASGAEPESSLVEKLNIIADEQGPDMVILAAGSYNRKDWISLSFEDFHRQHKDIALIAAAGNDSTSEPFHPAAAPWTISVGALGADGLHRAWFSNWGKVDVYALGEGIVNAYATGEYVYILPPRQGAIQTFDGMARWSGTSFSAPLVGGLIADEMWRTGSKVDMAAQAVLDRAEELDGVGRVLRVS